MKQKKLVLETLDQFIVSMVKNTNLTEEEKIGKIAYHQWLLQSEGTDEGLIEIGGTDSASVVYPWVDESGRFDVDPVEQYGEEHFKVFYNKLLEKMNAVQIKEGGI